MGQYWIPVNLTKKEFINPHKLGAGLKLWEQLANNPGTGAALTVLLAAMPEQRGGGDFDLDENWHGPERKFPEHNISPGPMPESYTAIARRTIGRWAGDQIALVGDYATDSDLAPEHMASQIYDQCHPKTETRYYKRKPRKGMAFKVMTPGDPHYGEYVADVEVEPSVYRDVTDDVCRVIEHELGGKYEGEGWRQWKEDVKTDS